MPTSELQKFRAKFPQYNDMPDREFASRILDRYPQYRDLLGDVAAPTQAGVAPSQPPRGRYLSGGAIDKVLDVVRTGEYSVGGALSRRPGETLGQAMLRGIREREGSGEQFAVRLQRAGLPDNRLTDALAFGASAVLDPTNLIGVGVPGKVLRGVGAARAAGVVDSLIPRAVAPVRAAVERGITRAAATGTGRVGGIARGIQAGRALEPVLEKAAIRETAGVDRAVDLGRSIRRDAVKTVRNRQAARELDRAVGRYIDAGADAMTSTRNLGANASRTAGQQAQAQYLAALPEQTRTFVQRWAPEVQRYDRDITENLVRVGMLPPAVAAKWDGFHLRRIYQKFEDPHAFVEFLQKTDPAQAAQLSGRLERGIPIGTTSRPIPRVGTARKALTEETRTGLGEITQASSRIVSGGNMAEQAIARGEAYADIARQFAVDVKSAPNPSRLRQMPETPGWGQLAGRWLPKEMADRLISSATKPGVIEKFLQDTTGWWKFSKTVLNPATQARNIYSNMLLAHNAAGLGALNPVTFGRALKEVLTNGQAFREAKSVSSVFSDTFTRSELRDFVTDTDNPRTLLRMLAAPGRAYVGGMSKAYSAAEQAGKMAVYLTEKGRGLSSEAAAKTAELAMFNYRKVPPWVDRARRLGMYPFITFPYKVATETLPQVVKRPGRAALQAKALAGFTEDLSEDEKRALPAHMRGGGWVKLPVKVNGHPVLFDLTYILPFGDVGEAGSPAATLARVLRGEGNIGEIAAIGLPPIVKIAAEIAMNRSTFTGREIAPEGTEGSERLGIQTAHVARQALPSVVSGFLPGGEASRAIASATSGGERGRSYYGQPAPSLGQAAASRLAGLRTQTLDVPFEMSRRRSELDRAIRDVTIQMAAVRKNQGMSDAAKIKRMERLEAQRQRIIERFERTGSARPQ